MSLLLTIVAYLAILCLSVLAVAVLLPPILHVLYSSMLWKCPPFSLIYRWWRYWFEKGY